MAERMAAPRPPPETTTAMRVMTWNILHGGGTARLPGIALAILDHRPDLVVLTEFRRSLGGQLRGVLADHGLEHQVSSDPGPGINGVLIASRWPAEPMPIETCGPRERLVACRTRGIAVIGVHTPELTRHTASRLLWRDLTEAARAQSEADCLVIGDFNAERWGVDGTDRRRAHRGGSRLMGRLQSLGYIDAWRAMHPGEKAASWVSWRGEGYRLDHAFLSRSLGVSLRSCRFSAVELEARLSDHAPLVLELSEGENPSGQGPPGPPGAKNPAKTV